jgi:hypothetical protein
MSFLLTVSGVLRPWRQYLGILARFWLMILNLLIK